MYGSVPERPSPYPLLSSSFDLDSAFQRDYDDRMYSFPLELIKDDEKEAEEGEDDRDSANGEDDS
ncbi:Heterogeneous nuclear ribonucleoprotein C [Tupaia chinensis]|uniref:Heterogeneous nuclear ribonucleoprotein C n=1 Tax=Tupaia chinensis TaxID=246437 RepID=L9L680_TUPCH|nr:Heterogeneous nuclear ribonucleoprotein C [Tupaia chinensis]